MKSFNEIRKTKEQEFKKYAEDRLANQSGLGRLPFLKPKNDNPTALKWLHSYDKRADFYLHRWDDNAKKPILEICELHYQETCRYCNIKSFQQATACMVGYIYSLVGQEWIIEEENGTTKSGLYNPVRLALIPYGEGGKNVKPFEMAHREKIFNSRIWLLTKSISKTGKGYSFNVPEILYDEDYAAKVGSQAPSMELSDKAAEITKLTSGEVFKFILSAFDNKDAVNKVLEVSGYKSVEPKIVKIEEFSLLGGGSSSPKEVQEDRVLTTSKDLSDFDNFLID